MRSAKKSTRKVLMALSGGVDSAVSLALLLEQGYQVEAAFMKNWSSQEGLKYDECPWLQDRHDALRVAAFFDVPMHTLNFEKQYEKHVLDYFFKEYQAGRTPNPDVMCNKEIKFKLLYNWAMKQGFDFLATGHYAQVEHGANPKLLRSKDNFKDQTYFIYNLAAKQLPHLLFPIGHLQKKQVKALAKKLRLPNAAKKESMGLCFVGKIRLKDFLDQKLKPKSGEILDQSGKVLGRHQGLAYYTIGQRHGINIGANGPWFVVKKNLKNNTLIVTNNPDDPDLLVSTIQLHTVNWINTPDLSQPITLWGRYRHQGKLERLTLERLAKDLYQVTFKRSQKAIASGQSLVLYDGQECLGGGVIV